MTFFKLDGTVQLHNWYLAGTWICDFTAQRPYSKDFTGTTN